MFSVGLNSSMHAPKYETKHETAGTIAYNKQSSPSFNSAETAGSIASSTPSTNSSSSFCAIA